MLSPVPTVLTSQTEHTCWTLCTLVLTGTYAEYATIKSSLLAIVPDNISFDQAAALPLVSLTALQASHLTTVCKVLTIVS